MALTTVVPGRVWDFSHAVGRNAAAGNGFSQPCCITLAGGGEAYVVSRGNETQFSGRVSKVKIGAPGEEEILAEFAYYGRGESDTQWPNSVGIDSQGNVYVSDDWRNRISVFSSDGSFQKAFGTTGAGNGEFDGPSGLAFDSDDNLYVVDGRNHRIQKVSKDGAFISSFGSKGDGPGQFNTPWGITIDGDGNIYVADWKNHRVQKFNSDGSYQQEFGGDLNHPSGVAVDPDGDVYVCDWGNDRVRIYDADGDPLASLVGDAQQLAKWAQESINANPDMLKMRRRVPSLEAEWRFCQPSSVAFDADTDSVIVTDNQRGRLQIYIKDRDYTEPQANL